LDEETGKKDTLEGIIDCIVEAVSPDRLVLFGSRAKGTNTPSSDFDILVVIDDGGNERDVSRKIYRAMVDRGVSSDVDIIVVSPRKLEEQRHNRTLIYHHALEEGVVVYG